MIKKNVFTLIIKIMLQSVERKSTNQTLRLVDRNRLIAQRVRVIPNEKLISNATEISKSQHNVLDNLLELPTEFDLNPNSSNDELLELSNSQMSAFFREFSDSQKTVCKEEKKNTTSSYKTIKGLGFYTCETCPFLCVNVKLFLEHNEKDHNFHHLPLKSLLRTKCIGCDNVFYSINVLRCHLIEDHDVVPIEVEELVQLVIEANKEETMNLNNARIYQPDNSDLDELNEIHDTILDESEFEQRSHYVDAQDQLTGDHNFNNCPMNETSVEFWDYQEQVFNGYQENNQLTDKNLMNKPFKCSIGNCKIKFGTDDNLKYHKRCHSDDGYQCSELDCHFMDTKWSKIMSHLWKTHNIDLEMFSCNKCNFKTNSLYKLKTFHKSIHEQDRPFLCTECGKKFKSVKQLRNHKVIHSKVDKRLRIDLTCLHCSRKFTSKSLLHQHISSIHIKARPFSCELCSYKTSIASSLRLHIRSHTGEKPFKCDECGYSTSDHNTLRKHKMRHTGKKSYTCPHCNYSCIQATSYKKHLNTKHPGLDDGFMYSCDMCKFKTVRKDTYMLHIVKHKEEIIQKNGVCEPLIDLQEVFNEKYKVQNDAVEQSYLFNTIRVKPLNTMKPNEIIE
ncbi:zinc finger protein 92-like [Daktulosphaira vitifoliae]|uniref:zinc finger protein 92-like n=1 Tax=Daktulosphaira vitifoliae TaxID=58002 RepID=UPI0021AA038E|nr:zinc finger protein 92-like [Daktulosphaira vitifoliae]